MTEVLTHTKRSTFKECRYRYYLRHEKHLELRNQKGGRRRGTAFGAAIFAVNQEIHAPALTFQMSGDAITGAKGLIDNTVDRVYEEALQAISSAEEYTDLAVEMVKVKVLALEYLAKYGTEERREVTFDLPLVNPETGMPSRTFTRGGKVDGMVTVGAHKARVIEDKLYQSIDKSLIEALPLDEQIFEYVDALKAKGWDADVEYRITRFPGINPAKAKEFKTKADQPAETEAEFAARLRLDIQSRPEFYFVSEVLLFDESMLARYRMERWDTAKDIMEARKTERWYRSTSRCKDFGGCIFLPHCRGHDPDFDMYVVVGDNVELAPAGTQPEEA